MISSIEHTTSERHRRIRQNSNKDNPPDQRSHFRLVCHIPASLKTILRTTSGHVVPGEPHKVLICNISGGGVRVLADVLLEVNNRILITFKLNDDILILTGVVRVVSKDPGAEYQYQYGIMFTGLSLKDQDIVYKYLFQEQTFRVLAD